MLDFETESELFKKAVKIRKLVIETTYAVQSGHPGSSLSIADILSVLYFHEMRYDPKNPDDPRRDRLILSKGHAAPALYAALSLAGFFPEEETFRLRQINAPLQGHPCNGIPGVDLTTGSLGLGLSGSVGIALGGKMRGSTARVYTILGDGEQGEGQVWEAAMSAAHFKLDNLAAFTDRNLYQNDGPTSLAMELEPLADKWLAFGWNVIAVDGHSLSEIADALAAARAVKGKPTMIYANTVKGRGASYMTDRPELHYTPPTKAQRDEAIGELEAACL